MRSLKYKWMTSKPLSPVYEHLITDYETLPVRSHPNPPSPCNLAGWGYFFLMV